MYFPNLSKGNERIKYKIKIVPNDNKGEKPLLFSTLAAKVSSITPICDARAVSLINIIKKPKAGGSITFHACGNIISTSVESHTSSSLW